MTAPEIFAYVTGVLEIVMLAIICWQGELIRRYEKWTYEMQKERHDQQMKWREQKRQQSLKKADDRPSSVEPITDSSENAIPKKLEISSDKKPRVGSEVSNQKSINPTP